VSKANEFISDCLRNYAEILKSGQIDGAGHYLPEDIESAADTVELIVAKNPKEIANQAYKSAHVLIDSLSHLSLQNDQIGEIKAICQLHIASLIGVELTGWQPIETAPLDGTLVDLWAERGAPYPSGNRHAERYADCRFAKNSYGTEPYGEPRWQGLNDRYIKVDPTHWMPIPKGPSE
jgi:hypothetical protein